MAINSSTLPAAVESTAVAVCSVPNSEGVSVPDAAAGPQAARIRVKTRKASIGVIFFIIFILHIFVDFAKA
jgi:hypothetical protein